MRGSWSSSACPAFHRQKAVADRRLETGGGRSFVEAECRGLPEAAAQLLPRRVTAVPRKLSSRQIARAAGTPPPKCSATSAFSGRHVAVPTLSGHRRPGIAVIRIDDARHPLDKSAAARSCMSRRCKMDESRSWPIPTDAARGSAPYDVDVANADGAAQQACEIGIQTCLLGERARACLRVLDLAAWSPRRLSTNSNGPRFAKATWRNATQCMVMRARHKHRRHRLRNQLHESPDRQYRHGAERALRPAADR